MYDDKQFINVKTKLADHFHEMQIKGKGLYDVDIDKHEIWDIYLNAFPESANQIYNTNVEQDCNTCKHFIRKAGGIVALDEDMNMESIWDVDLQDEEYQPSFDALAEYVKSRPIINLTMRDYETIGTPHNYQEIEGGSVITWEHYSVKLEPTNVAQDGSMLSKERGQNKTEYQLFKRLLDEISIDTWNTLYDLIKTGSLYKGDEWEHQVSSAKIAKQKYDTFDGIQQVNYVWNCVFYQNPTVLHMINTSFGVLLKDIEGGMDIIQAVTKFESIVAPENYKRSKPIYTKEMVENAQKTIKKLGYMDSLGRKHATIDEIELKNMLYYDADVNCRAKTEDVFSKLVKNAIIKPTTFDGIPEVSITEFLNKIVPNSSKIEVLFEEKNVSHLMSLISAQNPTSKSMFKWDNNIGWAYIGNMADSPLKKQVRTMGGNVDGVLRFSIQWNDVSRDKNDLDAHCITAEGDEIDFREKINISSGGSLDVDIQNPVLDIPAVENIIFEDERNLPYGEYVFFVHQYAYRGGDNGFRAEIEFNGEIHKFNYLKKLSQGESVDVASVIWDGKEFKIQNKIPSTEEGRTIWGVHTNTFIPVQLICKSPNHWTNNVGNEHIFFILQNCINDESPNGIYNEYLKQELIEHRKVFEALGSELSVEKSPDQLSGLGFSRTQRSQLIFRITDEKTYTIKVNI